MKTLIKATYKNINNIYELKEFNKNKNSLHVWLYKNNKLVGLVAISDIVNTFKEKIENQH